MHQVSVGLGNINRSLSKHDKWISLECSSPDKDVSNFAVQYKMYDPIGLHDSLYMQFPDCVNPFGFDHVDTTEAIKAWSRCFSFCVLNVDFQHKNKNIFTWCEILNTKSRCFGHVTKKRNARDGQSPLLTFHCIAFVEQPIVIIL